MNLNLSQNDLLTSQELSLNEEQLLKSLLEGTGEWGVVVVNKNARIMRANSLAPSLLKINARDFTGANFFELIPFHELNGADLKVEERPLYKVLYSKFRQVQPFFCSYILPRKKEKITLAVKVVGVHNPSGEIEGAVVYLREAQRNFDPKSVDRSFVSFAAHQLKTPAGAVQGFLEMVLRDSPNGMQSPRSYKYILSAYEANLSLIRSAKDLLNSAKLRGGLIQPDIRLFNVAQVLEQKLASHGQWLTNKKIHLKINYEMAGKPEIKTDSAIVAELFDILFHNALKFSNTGEVIEVRVRRQGNTVCIAVIDEGPGLAKAHSKIDEELSGSGMGLKVARQYAALLKGKLTYRDAEPKGSCFELELPDFS